MIDKTIVQLSATTSSATSPAACDLKNIFKHLSTKHLAMMAIALDDGERNAIGCMDILKRRTIEGEF